MVFQYLPSFLLVRVNELHKYLYVLTTSDHPNQEVMNPRPRRFKIQPRHNIQHIPILNILHIKSISSVEYNMLDIHDSVQPTIVFIRLSRQLNKEKKYQQLVIRHIEGVDFFLHIVFIQKLFLKITSYCLSYEWPLLKHTVAK